MTEAKEAQKKRFNAGRFMIFHRDEFRCFYCGRSSYGHNIELQVDHVVSSDKGGEGKAGNLVTSCKQCNQEKSIIFLSTTDEMLAEIRRRNDVSNIDDEMIIRLSPKGTMGEWKKRDEMIKISQAA